MKLHYTDIQLLKTKFEEREISLDKAKESLFQNFKEGQRSWHSKDWKERRSEFLKDKCQICSIKETLTIQHLSHPKKYYEYEREVTKKYSQSYKIENDFFDKDRLKGFMLKNYDYDAIPLCPQCDSRKPSKRISKVPQYRCKNCHHEFDELKSKSIEELINIYFENDSELSVKDKCFITKDKWRNKHNFKYIKYLMLRDQVKTENLELIEKEAFLLYLDDTVKYLSFSDTITACKKCASYYDLYNMELCPYCKENYKGVQYPTCIQCLPEEKRMNVLEIIREGKEMHEMHKNQGID